ncbi:MAG: S-layer homology domain-containing protein [Bacillota bacterium]
MRKTLHIGLIVMMLISLLPIFVTTTQPVHAADGDVGTMSALDALGIDSSVMPAGFDPDSTQNPYGRDSVMVNPVSELFLSHQYRDVDADTTYLDISLYGHNEPLNEGMGTFYDDETRRDTVSTDLGSEAPSLVATASAGGNFVDPDLYPDAMGKAGQVVTVGAGDWSSRGGLFMYFTDPHTGQTSDRVTLIEPDPEGELGAVLGNAGRRLDDEPFDESPHLLQNYLQIATGDFNNSGVHEVAVYIPEQGNSRVEVYQLKVTADHQEGDFLDAGNWIRVWTHYFNEDPFVSNMVSLTTGDFSRDGTDDLALTWGYYYGPGENSGSQAVVLFGDREDMLVERQEIELEYGTAPIVRAAFAFGDVTGDNSPELVLGGQLHTDIAEGNIYSRFVGIYLFDGEGFVQSAATNFDLFEKEDGEYVHAAMANHGNVFHSAPGCVANLAAVNTGGIGSPAEIYLDSLLIELGDEGLEITTALDNNGNVNRNLGGAQQSYAEYGVVAADFNGDSRETLQLMQCYLPRTTTEYELVLGWYLRWEPVDTYHPAKLDALAIFAGDGLSSSRMQDVNFSTSFCRLNTDEDTTLLEYTGEHRITYTDPKIMAVLASPPYFADLDQDDLSGSYMESETSFRSSTGSGDGTISSHTIRAGAYVNFEKDVKVFGVKVASWEVEAAYTYDHTWETQKMSEMQQSISYSTQAGQDSVAFYSIPMEIYEYNSFIPVVDEETGEVSEYDEQKVTVNIPHTAAVRILPLATYERIASDFSELPQIAGDILTHTLGNPSSYPSSTGGLNDPLTYDGDPAGVGFGLGAIEQEIEMSETEEKTYVHTHSADFKYGAGVGNVTVGVTAGYTHGHGRVEVTTDGCTYTAAVNDMPLEAEPWNYAYAWRLLAHEYSHGDVEFPVVTYLVEGVSTPPTLPKDFSQDVERTTSESITMTWSHRGPAAGFQIYRYYEFPDGSGSYELAFVSFDEYESVDGPVRHFSFTDEGLHPYTEYDYQIQVIDATPPPASILSQVIPFRTKADQGHPDLSLAGDLVDGRLEVFPDSQHTVEVVVQNLEDYGEAPRYQWQKLSPQGWTDIRGATNSSYTFSSSGRDAEGQYRCRVNVIYGSYHISGYSDAFAVDFSRRTPAVRSFTVEDAGSDPQIPTITLELQSQDHPDHLTRPYGNVVFDVVGADYSASYGVELLAVSDADGVTRATVTLDHALPEGVYEVNAFYSPNRVYRDLAVGPETYLAGEGQGYVLTLDSNYVYGSAMDPVLRLATKEGGLTTTEPPAGEVHFEVARWDAQTQTRGDVVPGFVDAGSVTAYQAGVFEIMAFVDGEEKTARSFTVLPREISVGITDQESPAGEETLVHPDHGILTVEEGTLAYDDAIGDLGLVVRAVDTAGTEVTIDSNTPPGWYQIAGAPGADAAENAVYRNYTLTYRSGRYILTGPTYPVTAQAEKLLESTVGSVELIAPESATDWPREYSVGTDITLLARPHRGYEVRDWTIRDGETGEVITPDRIPDTRLHHRMQHQGIEVTVRFQVAQNTLEFDVLAGEGTVECTSNEVFQSGDVAREGAEFEFLATPAEGYHFGEWTLTEVPRTPTTPTAIPQEDGTYGCELTMGSGNTHLYASFIRDSYTLTLDGQLMAEYRAEETDSWEPVPTDGGVQGDCEVRVQPRPGYSIPEDGVWTKDGEIVEAGVEADNQRFTFTMLRDTTVSAETEVGQFEVVLQSEGPGAEESAVEVTVNGLQAESDDLANVTGGSSLSFTADPAYGYLFDEWLLDGDSAGSDRVFNIGALGDDVTVTAVFSDNTPYTVTAGIEGIHGTLEYSLNDGTRNEVESGDVIDIFEGDDLVFTATPEQNFMVEKWWIDGELEDTLERTVTFEDIDRNREITVVFVAQTYSTVTYEAGSNGTILSATTDGIEFESGNQNIGNGTEIAFTAEPDEGYRVDRWYVAQPPDSDPVEVQNEHDRPLIDTTYRIPALRGSTHVEVTFREIVTHTVQFADQHTSTSFEVLPECATAEGEVMEEARVVFTVEPEAGYAIDSVAVQGNDGPENGFDNIAVEPNGSWTCEVLAVADNLAVTAEAKALHTISIPDLPVGGTITATPVEAIEGTEVTLTATPASRYRFDSWSVTEGVALSDENDERATFTMPAHDVEVGANFDRISSPSPSPSPSPPATEYDLTVAVEGEGSTNPATGTHAYSQGATVTVRATPDEGWVFIEWRVNGQSDSTTEDRITIDVDADLSVTAVFAELPPDMPSASGVVDPETGGRVEIPGMISLVLPAEATTNPVGVRVLLRSVDDPDMENVIGTRIALGGLVYEIMVTEVDEDGEQGERIREFSETLELNISYSGSDVSDPRELVIHVYDEGLGTWVPLPTSIDEIDNEVSTRLNHLSRFAVFGVPDRMTDIDGHWGEADILRLAAVGAVSGYPDASFKPENRVTREQFARMLVDAAGLAVVSDARQTQATFDDFDDISEWARPYVETAVTSGLIAGYEDGSFRARENVTRAQIAVMLSRALELIPAGVPNFADGGEIPEWAAGHVAVLGELDIVRGLPGNVFAPHGETTRAEAATFLSRYLSERLR